jgi:hypothetical protein
MIDTSFDPALIQKCENLLALSPSNLYVIRPEEIVPFVRMQTPALISRMITASLKKQAHALEHFMQNRGGEQTLLVWIDPFRLGYVLLAVESPDGERSIVSFGPVITERLSAEELRYIGFQMKLSSTAGKLFEAFLAQSRRSISHPSSALPPFWPRTFTGGRRLLHTGGTSPCGSIRSRRTAGRCV